MVERRGYGPNWPKQRRAALERDKYTCQKCGFVGSQVGKRRHWNVFVHHRRKISWFVDSHTGQIDYEAANSLDNLITLCDRCHKTADRHDDPSKRGFTYVK